MFSKTQHGKYIFILVYVEDLFITGDDVSGIRQIKRDLHTAYTIKDLGLARYFLGIEISEYFPQSEEIHSIYPN